MTASVLDPYRDRARAALAAGTDVAELLAEAEARAAASPALADSVPGLCRFVAAHADGEYLYAEEEEVELALAAILYVVSPWDQTPDYLPDGLRDDEVVTRAVALELERALREFEAFRDPAARRAHRRV